MEGVPLAHGKTEEFVRRSYERWFEAGSAIFEQGDPGNTFFVIQAGEVELWRLGSAGRQVVGRLGAGDFCGEMSVLVEEPRRERAVATSDCRVLEIDGATLESMCVDRPEIGIRIIQCLTERLLESERHLAARGVDDPLRPVVRSLVRSAGGRDSGGSLPASLRNLARDSGLSLPDAHRALQELLDQKLVLFVDEELQIPDVERLSACLDSPS